MVYLTHNLTAADEFNKTQDKIERTDDAVVPMNLSLRSDLTELPDDAKSLVINKLGDMTNADDLVYPQENLQIEASEEADMLEVSERPAEHGQPGGLPSSDLNSEFPAFNEPTTPKHLQDTSSFSSSLESSSNPHSHESRIGFRPEYPTFNLPNPPNHLQDARRFSSSLESSSNPHSHADPRINYPSQPYPSYNEQRQQEMMRALDLQQNPMQNYGPPYTNLNPQYAMLSHEQFPQARMPSFERSFKDMQNEDLRSGQPGQHPFMYSGYPAAALSDFQYPVELMGPQRRNVRDNYGEMRDQSEQMNVYPQDGGWRNN